MTTLGVNMTENDKTYGWADITPNHRQVDPFGVLAIQAWRFYCYMVDNCDDRDKLNSILRTAEELTTIALLGDDCTCTTPEQFCNVCRVQASLIYDDDYIKWCKSEI